MKQAAGARPCAFLLAASLALGAAPALATTKEQCVDANTHAQVLRRDHRFAEARRELQVCVDTSCPGLVRDDCVQRLDELNGAQPTLVFDVKDAAGADLAVVTVTVDGQPLADKLDGSAVLVDPGAHTFTFQVTGKPPVSRSVVVKEGEKQRRERVLLGAERPQGSPAPDAAALRGARTRQTVGLAIGGVGLAGLGVGSAFGLLAMSRWNSAKSECNATTCPHHGQAVTDHAATVTFGAASTAGFVAGGALLVTGAVLFFTGRRDAARAAREVAVSPIAGPGTAGLVARGSF